MPRSADRMRWRSPRRRVALTRLAASWGHAQRVRAADASVVLVDRVTVVNDTALPLCAVARPAAVGFPFAPADATAWRPPSTVDAAAEGAVAFHASAAAAAAAAATSAPPLVAATADQEWWLHLSGALPAEWVVSRAVPVREHVSVPVLLHHRTSHTTYLVTCVVTPVSAIGPSGPALRCVVRPEPAPFVLVNRLSQPLLFGPPQPSAWRSATARPVNCACARAGSRRVGAGSLTASSTLVGGGGGGRE